MKPNQTPPPEEKDAAQTEDVVGVDVPRRWLSARINVRKIQPITRWAMGNWRPIRIGYLPKSKPCGTWDAMPDVLEMFRVWILDLIVIEIIPPNADVLAPAGEKTPTKKTDV